MADHTSQTIRLTQTVKKGGCAAKLPPRKLQSILKKLDLHSSPQLLTKAETWDDAAIWDISSEPNALIQTLDFFTPVVDDPYHFGQIAAVNAMSDVYAMGGYPKLALSILAFPANVLDVEIIRPLMEGALERIHKAGALLVGGHTIDDDTLKLGFAVNAFVSKDKFWSNAKAQVDDSLILTKPLGVGTLIAAFKKENTAQTNQWLSEAISSMTQLNNVIDFCSLDDVHSATDITGFGLLGHAYQMAKASRVSFEIYSGKIPKLPGSLTTLKQEHLVRAHFTNADYVKDHVDYGSTTEDIRCLLNDPQTSGGLLLSVPSDRAFHVCADLVKVFPYTKVIGKVINQYPDTSVFIR